MRFEICKLVGVNYYNKDITISMELNILKLILLITVVISMMALNNKTLMDKMMFIPYETKHNSNYVRVLSHMLIHADYMHLLFNMISLYYLGNSLLNFPGGLISEFGVFSGQIHFLALYVLGGLFATLIPFTRNQDNPNYRSLGASGAISSVIFAAIIWEPSMKLNLMFIPIDIPAYIFGPLYLLYEFYQDKRGNTGVAHDAHIGGAIFGVIYVLIINIDKGTTFVNYIF